MDFGIALIADAQAWRLARRAEELGFTHAWFYDSQLLCTDVFVAMTAAAMNTSTIRLGAGVLVPSNRLAPVAANALASLNALAPGRVIAGLGTGYTARRTLGLRAQKLAEIREYVRVMQGLWNGDTVAAVLEGSERSFRFMHPNDRFVNTADPIPVHISAFGPRARQMAAEVADGFINAWMSPAVLEDIGIVRDAARQAGRDPASMYATCLNLGCVLEPGEPYDSSRAKAQAGPMVAIGLHWLVEDNDPSRVPPALAHTIREYRRLYESYQPAQERHLRLHEGHLLYLRPDEDHFVTADMIREQTLTGTPEVIRDRVAQLDAAGYDQVAVQIVPGHENAIDDWARVLLH